MTNKVVEYLRKVSSLTKIFNINILYVSVVLIREQLSCEAKLFFVSQYLALVVFTEPQLQITEQLIFGCLSESKEHIASSRSVISINLTKYEEYFNVILLKLSVFRLWWVVCSAAVLVESQRRITNRSIYTAADRALPCECEPAYCLCPPQP